MTPMAVEKPKRRNLMAGIYDRPRRSEFELAQRDYRRMIKESHMCELALYFPIYWDEMQRIKHLCYNRAAH